LIRGFSQSLYQTGGSLWYSVNGSCESLIETSNVNYLIDIKNDTKSDIIYFLELIFFKNR